MEKKESNYNLYEVIEKALGNTRIEQEKITNEPEIIGAILEGVYNSSLENRLKIYYEYEKHYLDVLKDYKEEIKFASALLEDVRKERANFFSEKLKEVSDTLKETGVDDNVRCQWIKELVKSYTGSLDVSSQLAEEHIVETVNEIKNKETEIVKQFKK